MTPSPTSAAYHHGPAPSSTGWILASLALCTLLPSLGISIANVGLPTLAQAFGASFHQVQWVVIAYLLGNTVLIVGVGRLGDLLGRRRLLIGGIVVFAAASLLGGFAPALGWLVAARAVQGVGAAVLVALSMAFIGDTVPREQTGRAMGLLGTMSAVGTALGPSLGGALVAAAGWPALFFVKLPLALLAFGLVWRHLPPDRPTPALAASRFDLPGTVLLALTLLAYALAMTLGHGRFGLPNAALLVSAAGGLVAFVRVQAHTGSPLVRLETFRDPPLRASLAAAVLVSSVMMSTLVVGPFYLAQGLALPTALVGLVMSIGPAVAALAGVPAGRLVDRFGPERTTLAALIGLAIGSTVLCLAPQAWGIAGYAVPLAMMTAHFALFQAANNTAVMQDVAPERRGVMSGLLQLSRNLGFITGASVMGAVFALASGAPEPAAASPSATGAGLRTTFAVATVLIVLAAALVAAGRRGRPPRRAQDGPRPQASSR